MAITKCEDCGGQVSDKADACPHCGFKNPKLTERNATFRNLIIAIALVTGVVLYLNHRDKVAKAEKAAKIEHWEKVSKQIAEAMYPSSKEE